MALPSRVNIENSVEIMDSGSLTIEVHRTFPENQEAWDELVEATDAGIYLTYDWCKAWWAQYGFNRSLRIYLFYETKSHDLVGVMPMFIDAIGIGLLHIRLAKTVGADFTIATCEPPIYQRWMSQAIERLISELTNKESCDAILLGPLVSAENQELVRSCANQMCNAVKLITNCSRWPQTIFECPDTLEDHMKSLGKSVRKGCREKWNRLCKAYRIKEESLMEPFENGHAFMEFMDMHTSQWIEEGQLGHFGDWPLAEKFHIDVANRQASRRRFFLLRILDGDQALTYQYVYGCGKTLHWLLPARRSDPELERMSLGWISLLRMINWAIGEGYSRIDAGPGHFPYKLHLGARELARQSALIIRNKPASRLRCFVLRRQGELLDLFYYRLWFERIAPKLGLQKPLWKIWIRTQMT